MEVKCRVCGKRGGRGKPLDPIMKPIPDNCPQTEEGNDWMLECRSIVASDLGRAASRTVRIRGG